jgi:hypothetical protein
MLARKLGILIIGETRGDGQRDRRSAAEGNEAMQKEEQRDLMNLDAK